ncbi:hypothetical protein ACFW2V_24995 [Streptomyces sp. NPDC058947]|uniref:hypothetical protein n=1 Tax=Streptomyces sp. NPDC058947 TaxID=3346675 RepID=UPI0036AD964F
MPTPAFAGRTGPLTAFARALDDAASSGIATVLYVHGPAGIGRTALLQRFAALARDAGHPVVEGLTGGANQDGWPPSGAVLLVDDVDRLRGPDGSLPPGLLPRAGRGTVTVVAGEYGPDTAWRVAAAGVARSRVLALGPLGDDEARLALAGTGLPAEGVEAVADFAGGHPLALTLAAAAWLEGSFRDGRPPQDVVLALLDHVVGEVPESAHRQALEIAAHSRWTTEDLLRAALTESGAAPARVFDWLRRRPFALAERHGVSLPPFVRDLLDADLRWRDPSGYRALHERIRGHLLDRIRHALPHQVLSATLAFTYLHRRNGFVSRFVTWEDDGRYRELRYRPEMRDEVLALVAETEGDDAAAATADRLDDRPRAFRVYWDTATGTPAAVLGTLRCEDSGAEPPDDPVAAAALRHTRANRPLRPGEQLALLRVYAPASAHRAASSLMDLIVHRILVSFMRETPAWSFVATASESFLAPLLRYIDQRPLRPLVGVDGTSLTLYAHDWRAVTIERWMEVGHLAELAGPEGRPAARPRSGSGALTVLTREEFDGAVLAALTAWRRPDVLAGNPLLRTRLVAGRGGDPVEALREVVTEAVDTLATDPRAQKYHRALLTGFLQGSPTREAAAERLGLPLSTFRRHMSRGLERVRAALWDWEARPREVAEEAAGPPPPR